MLLGVQPELLVEPSQLALRGGREVEVGNKPSPAKTATEDRASAATKLFMDAVPLSLRRVGVGFQ